MLENGREFVDVVVGEGDGLGAKVVMAMDVVVKVFFVHMKPNFSLPWQRKRQYSSSSSGFVIAGRRILTNAHSVEHFTQVKLKKHGSDTKFLATVLAIGTECNIGTPFLLFGDFVWNRYLSFIWVRFCGGVWMPRISGKLGVIDFVFCDRCSVSLCECSKCV